MKFTFYIYIVSYFDFKRMGCFYKNNTGISILESQNKCWALCVPLLLYNLYLFYLNLYIYLNILDY